MGIGAALVAVGSWLGGVITAGVTFSATTGVLASALAGAISGAIVGAVVGGVMAAFNGGKIGEGMLSGAIGGAVTGGLMGAVGSIYGQATSSLNTVGEAGVLDSGATISANVGDAAGSVDKGLDVLADAPIGADVNTTMLQADKAVSTAETGGSVGVKALEGVDTAWEGIKNVGSGLSDEAQAALIQGGSTMVGALADDSSGDQLRSDQEQRALLASEGVLNRENNLAQIREQGNQARRNYWEAYDVDRKGLLDRSTTMSGMGLA